MIRAMKREARFGAEAETIVPIDERIAPHSTPYFLDMISATQPLERELIDADRRIQETYTPCMVGESDPAVELNWCISVTGPIHPVSPINTLA